MKKIILVLSIAVFAILLLSNNGNVFAAGTEEAILLHHSTGGNLYSEGNVADYVQNYNSTNGTSYAIDERAYPTSPYPWNNYPYDWWNLWVTENEDGTVRTPACDSSNSNIECLNTLTQSYNTIIFKQCYPGADVLADTGTPDITSSRKSLENYKAQYRALRREFDKYPNNLFIAWTLVPRHRLATNTENAARAKQFVDWVKNDWLTEDGQSHPNIKIFDFWGNVAETNSNPSQGQVNTLKYEYERSHTGSDSHPNTLANQTVGPIFAQEVIDDMAVFFNTENSPTISFLTDNSPTHQSIITISGSNFGIHNNNNEGDYTWGNTTPINSKFKDFEDGLVESQGFHVENGYSDEWQTGSENARDNSFYYGVRRYVNTRLAMLRYAQSNKSTGEIFSSFYMKVHSSGSSPSTGKPWRWYFGDDTSRDNMYLAVNSGGNFSSHSESSGSGGDFFGFTPDFDQWYRIDIYASYPDRVFRVYVNGEFKNEESDYFDEAVFNPDGHGVQWGYIDSSEYGDWAYDDLYTDYTQARVEICDISSWLDNSSHHCEIQIPTSWTDSAISVVFNQGSFNSGDQVYLYVIDENGNVNQNGYPITIGQSSTTIRADVDNNSTINTTDAMLTLRNSLGLSMSGTNWFFSATTGDVNCDGTSNSTDAMLILRYSLGLSMEGTGWCR